MKIEEYLQDSNNFNWDFTNEFACFAYKELFNPFDKHFIYKACNCNPAEQSIKQYLNASQFIEHAKKYNRIQDPDNKSNLLQEIYKLLWPNLVNQEFMLHKCRIQSDTMTSSQRTLNEIIKNIETEDEKKSRGRYRISNLYSLELYSRNKDDFIERLNNVSGLWDFIERYQTLGNYIAVPYLFNAARSGSFANHDYWDLTLQKIQEWYFEKDGSKKNNIINELLHHKGDKEKCSSWLEYFGEGENGWITFINNYYLQDFVDCDYKPIPFCENHSWGNLKIYDYNIFLENVSKKIYLRGLRMYEDLKIKS